MHWRIVAHVHRVAAIQVSDPISFGVLMKANDPTFHQAYTGCSRYMSYNVGHISEGARLASRWALAQCS